MSISPRRSGESRLGGQERKAPIGLVGLSEPETMRHFVRLSQKNYGIDTGLFPLGSCTMKHNPRLNEKMARLPGFSDIHPLQPQSTVQGALELIELLAHYLMTLTGTEAVAMSPKAGAHGELCGMMAIKAAIEAKGEGATRRVVLVPDSAHGTKPCHRRLDGFEVKPVPARADGTVHVKDVKKLLGPDVAAIMLTNPNTCGIFEPEIVEIARAMKKAGAYFYCDGAKFQRHVGKAKPGDLGSIACTSTCTRPSRRRMAAVVPVLARWCSRSVLRRSRRCRSSAARARSWSSSSMWRCRQGAALRARHGLPRPDGHVCARAGLYAQPRRGWHEAGIGRRRAFRQLHPRGLQDLMSVPFPEHPSMHEALFDDTWLKDTGVTTLDFAKAMIDEGYHPMTMYFPLVVHGAMLVEPTESKAGASLDLFTWPCATSRCAPSAARPSASRARRSTPHAAGLMKRARLAIPSCAGHHRSRCSRQRRVNQKGPGNGPFFVSRPECFPAKKAYPRESGNSGPFIP